MHFNELKKEAPYKNLWICKPNSSCQGKGIYITDTLHDVDRVDKCVISRYIHNPLLINSHKFDLRIYVLITSFEPLKIYVYQEGLTRFASEPYSSGTKFNKFSHLTNYSINKKNANFVQNQDLEHDDFGFKWSLSALCGHLEQIGIDMDLLWSKIYDLIIKSIIAAEDKIQAGINKFCNHKTNCFEVLGFDVLIDSELKPWLLEANLSPSLSSDSPLDFKIKSNLITDAFNIVGFKKYDRRKESVNKIKHRMKGLYARGKSLNSRYGNNFSQNYKDKSSMKSFVNASNKDVDSELVRYLQQDTTLAPYKNIIKKLIPMKFKDVLKDALIENSKRTNFLRIYPAKGTDIYDKYFKSVRPYNVFLYKCLYTNDILPIGIENGIGEVPAPMPISVHTLPPRGDEASSSQSTAYQSSAASIKPKASKAQRPQTVKVGSNPSMKAPENNEKIIITGDDVLIEYVQRMINALSMLSEEALTPDIRLAIDKFILHYVWHNKDPASEKPTASLKDRLTVRYEEMRQRRKRLVRSIYKREGKLDLFEASYKKMTQQKMAVLQNFDGRKLEDMLKTSTKNVAQEVVSILINHSRELSYGLLPDLETNYLKISKTSESYSKRTIQSKSNSRAPGTHKQNLADSQDELEACAEDEDKEEDEVVHKQVLATSCSANVNKFSNISDFNNKLNNAPPQIPPTVNYNNYFNNTKYRYSSKSRKPNVTSSLTTQNESKGRIKNAKRSENSNQRLEADIKGRRNSSRSHENQRQSLKSDNKTVTESLINGKISLFIYLSTF